MCRLISLQDISMIATLCCVAICVDHECATTDLVIIMRFLVVAGASIFFYSHTHAATCPKPASTQYINVRSSIEVLWLFRSESRWYVLSFTSCCPSLTLNMQRPVLWRYDFIIISQLLMADSGSQLVNAPIVHWENLTSVVSHW